MELGPGCIGGIRDFETLRAALAQRKRDLRMSNLELDHVAKLQSGYTGKIMCGTKRPGDMSLPALLGALGAELVLVPSSAKDRAEWRAEHAIALDALKKVMSARGKKGAAKRVLRTTEAERSRHAKKMNRVRWAKARAKRRLELEGGADPKRSVRHAPDVAETARG